MLSQLTNLFLIVLMAAPALAGGASAMRIAYPALAFIVALYLYTSRRFPQYITFCLWLFILTPLVRRVVDLQAGWVEPNYLLLASYAALIPCMASSFAKIFSSRRLTWLSAAAVIVFAAVYGTVIAVLNGRPTSAIYDLLRWIAPLCFGVFVYETTAQDDSLEKSLRSMLLLAVPLVGLYSIYQFVMVPAWDAYWMVESKMTTIGTPFPYQVRVFGPLNSPGSFSFILVMSLLLLFAMNIVVAWPAILLGIVALALTLVRSLWGGMVLGLVMLLVIGTPKVRAVVTTIVIISAVFGPSLLFIPQARYVLEDRVMTMMDLSQDTSYNERAEGYRRGIQGLSENVFGQGLALSGAYQAFIDKNQVQIIDGGPIEIFSELGFPMGATYFIAFACIAVGVLRAKAVNSAYMASCKAAVLVGTALLWSSTVTLGEQGVFLWLCVGLAFGLSERAGRIGLLKKQPA